jgi:ATP-binding cassette subfamily B protein
MMPVGGFSGPMQRGGPGPFTGIPPELQAGVAAIEETEPAREPSQLAFSQQPPAAPRRLTLGNLLRGHRALLAGAALSIVVFSVSQQVGPRLIEWAIDDGMVPPARHSVLVEASLLFLASVLVAVLAQRWQVQVTGRLAARVMHGLRVRVFDHLQRLSLDYYTREKAGVVMSRMTSDIENLQQLLQDGLAQFAVQLLTMAVIIVILFSINAALAAITVLMIVPTLTALSWWFQHAAQFGFVRVRDRLASVIAHLAETLQGIRVVIAHDRGTVNERDHQAITHRYWQANDYTARISAIYGPSTQLISFIAQAVLLGVGGRMVAQGSLQVGELIAFFLYLNRFFAPIQLLTQQYSTLQQGQASLTKLRELLAEAPSAPEPPNAGVLAPIRGQLTLRHVSFGYSPDRLVLHDVDLQIEPGQMVAFVGPTGAGKSTIAKLVSRFYDPVAGQVLIDGQPIDAITLDSLRRQVGVVPQEPFLFSGTVRENLAFGRPSATDAELLAAVRRLGAQGILDRLPDGLDTIVQERGQSLSSGERQLIALIRAFIANPRVLVLDEATSNMDGRSEAIIEQAMHELFAGRTALVIAHRLSTAARADVIVVVRDGRLVEAGSHRELIAADGYYAEMFRAWTSQRAGDRH